jgi:DNA modification methylase
MKGIPDQSINFICTDLPYAVTNCKWDSVIPFEPMWEQYLRILNPKGCIALFAQAPFDKALAMSNIKMFKYEIIYEKHHQTNFYNCYRSPLKNHENILLFYNKQPTYNPQKTKGHKRKVVKASSRKSIESEIWNKVVEFKDYDSTERFPRSVVKFKSDRYKEALHPTQKPVELIEYLLKTYMNQNSDEIVLDSCMGSGTACIAAINVGVNYIGIEKEEKYFEIAKARIENHLKEKGEPI